jgi:hypothetical protein
LNRIAFFRNRRDEVPNQELAKELARAKDRKGIREIADHLYDDNSRIQSDCIKVLYEIGYLDPTLITKYADRFVKSLEGKNNRLVWGGMIALSTVAALKAKELHPYREAIMRAIDKGSVITQDNGVEVLARIASVRPAYEGDIFPYLLRHLATCRPKDVAQRSEKTVVAVNAKNKRAFIRVLEQRLSSLSGTQKSRVKRVIRTAESQV